MFPRPGFTSVHRAGKAQYDGHTAYPVVPRPGYPESSGYDMGNIWHPVCGPVSGKCVAAGCVSAWRQSAVAGGSPGGKRCIAILADNGFAGCCHRNRVPGELPSGALALLVGRFIGFVRTLLPLLAGISGIRQKRFLLYSWVGAFLWIGTLMMAGEMLTTVPFFRQHESTGMTLRLVLPVLLLVVGVAGSLMVFCRRKNRKSVQ